MSEEILKALMQLFAIIAKQDEGVQTNEKKYVLNFLAQQLPAETAAEFLALFDKYSQDDGKGPRSKPGTTSVQDSVRIFNICRKINKTLTLSQKYVVLMRLFELVNADRRFTKQRMTIINTVGEVFNLSRENFDAVESFVIKNLPYEMDFPHILHIGQTEDELFLAKSIDVHNLDGHMYILRITEVELYFLKYTGNEDIYLNGLPVSNKRVYLFANGSTIKLNREKPIYYSDVISHFLTGTSDTQILYKVENVSYKFSNGKYGIQNINFLENEGKLIGIMGTSGSGKTTMLNVLSGLENPFEGKITINQLDLHKEKEKLKGVIGYIPQDDLLIEELTVFQNLYYNAKFCFSNKPDEEINALVDKTLNSLGLGEIKNLRVGNALNKLISGGQRKRLNIALELIREPSILFVDEPTSGLSSRDSENVMDLLRELSLKGKLIFVVIHQPSSDIYKMFDNILILDLGGHMIYYGNPVEAVMYFKRMDAQINSNVGECSSCGNVNSEIVFNIIDAKIVDEFGRYTQKRKVSPQKWENYFNATYQVKKVPESTEKPNSTLHIPGWFKQTFVYTIRDFLSKISNKQYILLNLLEAPVLGLMLAYLIRYIADPNSNTYIFRENENIPIYIFMSIIVALFLGLTISAEEIFKDRKILKREAFLNLSRSSYLTSKVLILLAIGAIQSFFFVIIGNTILEINEMYVEYWLALFTISAFGNLLGLNISSSFNSVITIYILIPLLMIPQMLLGGAMFSFDKLNRTIGSVEKVPFVADIMATKWAYEGLMVDHFKNNPFEKEFFDIEQNESVADFKQVYAIPKLEDALDSVKKELSVYGQIEQSYPFLLLLKNEIQKESIQVKDVAPPGLHGFTQKDFTLALSDSVKNYLNMLKQHYTRQFFEANSQKDKKNQYWLAKNNEYYLKMRNNYHNENVEDIVKKIYEKNKLLVYHNELVQQFHPIFRNPETDGYFDFRAHFFAPRKYFMGRFFETLYFNLSIIWCMTILLYGSLYFDLMKRLLNLFSRKR